MSVEHLTCPEDLARLRLQSARQTAEDTVTIAVCMDACCCAKGAEDVWSAFETAISIAAERGLHTELKRTACHGLCERGPLVIIAPGDILYQNVKPENVTQIVEETVVGGRVLESRVYEDTCMVNVARYFLDFLREESCGKCTACREGIAQMCDILNRICAGEGREGDVELLLDLCQILEDAALCALGTSAANPVRSTIRYFQDEYDQHIRDHYCPAHGCRGLFSYEMVVEECRGCGACLKECPVEAISGEKRKPHALDQSLCVRCGACFDACSFSAIARVKPRVKSIASAAVQVEGS